MSNSRAKYEQLQQDPSFVDSTQHQTSVGTIVQILHASEHISLTKDLLAKVVEISKQGPNLSPVVVFQIAADAIKVDELCNTK